jgi:hypothetical protein
MTIWVAAVSSFADLNMTPWHNAGDGMDPLVSLLQIDQESNDDAQKNTDQHATDSIQGIAADPSQRYNGDGGQYQDPVDDFPRSLTLFWGSAIMGRST